MSKYVKGLITDDLSRRLDGVEDAVLVNVIGLDANKSHTLRKSLREKNIHLLVVKSSLARRATEGTRLGAAFEGATGSLAVAWGAEDFISLAKEITSIHKGKEFELFQTQGGVMDGEHLTAERVEEISKWPSRVEQLSILVGQVLSPGSQLAGALVGAGGALASQIKKKSEGDGSPDSDGAAAEGAGAESPEAEA